MNRLNKILIANRGEISLRIIRAARLLNTLTVAVFSAGEENALHVLTADEAVPLGAGSLNDTYLNIEKIISAAKETGAEAIHPGYGFLSESYLLAEACCSNGIRFVGPSPEVLRLMGNKPEAKAIAESIGIPTLKNHKVNIQNINEMTSLLPYPVMIKSVHGGGGKGMQVAYSAEELNNKVQKTSRMAFNYFGNGEVYLEPYVEQARHIEVQVLGDNFGNLVHLYERDCTLQRNYQKIIEEAPAPGLDEKTRNELLGAALKLCRSISYSGAGTVEFLLGNNGRYYFMEMNPRIQVEHPVTEEVTGIDIVKEQLSIAAGNPLSFTQDDIGINGHAIEVRLYGEDPSNGFAPSTSPVTFFRFPERTNIRIESDLSEGSASSETQFDPLLCKIIAKGNHREEALSLMNAVLRETIISGTLTNQQYLRALLQKVEVVQSSTDTRFCENRLGELLKMVENEKAEAPIDLITAAFLLLRFLPNDPNSSNPWIRLGFRNSLNQADVHVNGLRYNVPFSTLRHKYLTSKDKPGKGELSQGAIPFRFKWLNENITAFGRIVSGHTVKVTTEKKSGEFIFTATNTGETKLFWHGFEFLMGSHDLLDYYPNAGKYIEADKLVGENLIISHLHGKVIYIQVTPGQIINKGDLLMVIESMKSEIHILSHKNAKINTIEVAVGSQVTDRMPLIKLEEI